MTSVTVAPLNSARVCAALNSSAELATAPTLIVTSTAVLVRSRVRFKALKSAPSVPVAAGRIPATASTSTPPLLSPNLSKPAALRIPALEKRTEEFSPAAPEVFTTLLPAATEVNPVYAADGLNAMTLAWILVLRSVMSVTDPPRSNKSNSKGPSPLIVMARRR